MTAQCLQLDMGNSSAKWRLKRDGEIVARGEFRHNAPETMEALLAQPVEPAYIWIASVSSEATEDAVRRRLQQRWPRAKFWFARSEARSGDLVNSYTQPLRMGVDRWLAMLGARERCQQRLAVVDAGSALTIDLVAADGHHEGGYIIPGAALMERALLLDTDRVRFAEQPVYALAPGRSTAEAVRHGIALSQAGAVLLALRKAGDPAPELVFCGGAGETLQALLGGVGKLHPDLVFEGLEVLAGLRGGE
ncbi:MAG TPA: type III pantothenate kinase [Haliea salexigens]|uniref:Type III pantothenate kinase n=1 Tax=Haliea salexigens TaxID=287487 RepID=A0A3C1KIC0_9GAMM|nr:type III pantothenate kinase [Haliea sp.]HAN26243.1 type III pantothenate kinase [Haliea salexigens]|tara:strand:- start:3223 stop:3969 length:747 start_codon:yes stop_codon:yes gene_type:complete